MGERAPETLVVAAANRDAALLLANWRAWPGGALALIGPLGSGKTHLALAWAAEQGARLLAPDAAPEAAIAAFEAGGGRLVLDDADGPHRDETLIRVLDLARSRGGAALLTGAAPPAQWSTQIKDLASRLAALAVAALGEPDVALLEVVLRRLCRERFIQLRDDALTYLVENMQPSFAAAHAVAEALDAMVVRGRRPVTPALARRALLAAEKALEENP
ncbi:MAG: hypothetical protein AB7L65_03820 [Hyphomonadaceae bacterium]